MSYDFPPFDVPHRPGSRFSCSITNDELVNSGKNRLTEPDLYSEDAIADILDDHWHDVVEHLNNGPRNKRDRGSRDSYGRAQSFSADYLVKAYFSQSLTWISANGKHHAIATMEQSHAGNSANYLVRVADQIQELGGFKPSGNIYDTALYQALNIRAMERDEPVPPGKYDMIINSHGEAYILEHKNTAAQDAFHAPKVELTAQQLYGEFRFGQWDAGSSTKPWLTLPKADKATWYRIAERVAEFADTSVVEYLSNAGL